jgi:hypothetical protein
MRTSTLFAAALLLACQQMPPPDNPLDGGVEGGVDLPAPTPSLSTLVPPSGYLDRTVVLQLGGVNTHFESGTIVDFGDPGIGLAWTFKSETNLTIYATIDDSARIGPHDVSVKTFGPRQDQAVDLVLKGGFTVEGSLTLAPLADDPVQGQLTQVEVIDQDYRDNPFGASSVTIVEGPRLLNLLATTSTRYSWIGLMDALTPEQPLVISLTSKNPLGDTMSYRTTPTDKNARVVRRRAATLLGENQTKTGEVLSRPLASNLYRVDSPDAGRVLMLSYENVGVGLLLDNLTTVTAPASGSFADGQHVDFPSLNQTTYTALAWLADSGPTYLSVFAGTLAGDAARYTYDVTARTAAAMRLDLTELQPDSPAAPLALVALDGPVFSDNGSIDPASDMDYIAFTPSVTGRVHAQATGSQAHALKISFMQADCTTPVTVSRGFQHEVAVNAGQRYCLRLSAATATPYRLILTPQL